MKYTVKTEFNQVYVLLKVSPYSTVSGRKFVMNKISEKLFMKFPFYLVGTATDPEEDFSDIFLQFENTLNNHILKEIEFIVAYVSGQASKQGLDIPAGVDVTIETIKSIKDEDFNEVKEWKPISLL